MAITLGDTAVGWGVAGWPFQPTGLLEGDFLLAVIEGEGEDTAADEMVDTSAWTLVGSVASATGGAADATRISVWWAWYTAGLNLNVADAGNHTIGVLTAWRGVDPTTPFAGSATSATDATNDAVADGPSITTTADDAVVVFCLAAGDNVDYANLSFPVSLTGTATAATVKATSGSDGAVGVFYGTKATAGGTGGFTANTQQAAVNVNEGTAAITVALRPRLPADLPITAGGSGTTDGAAALTLVPSSTDYPMAASGSGASNGAAVVARTTTITAGGAGTSAGAAQVAAVRPVSAGGTGASDGSATLIATLPASASGSGVSGGAATIAATLPTSASGSGLSDGAATLAASTTASASGSGSSGGAATISIVTPLLVTADGSGATGGSAVILAERPLAASGAGVSGGAVSATWTQAVSATGAGSTDGAIVTVGTLAASAAGSGASGGSAVIGLAQPAQPLSAAGSGNSGGAASLTATLSAGATGTGASAGSAALARSTTMSAAGSGGSSGSAQTRCTRPIVASGSSLTGGAGSIGLRPPIAWAVTSDGFGTTSGRGRITMPAKPWRFTISISDNDGVYGLRPPTTVSTTSRERIPAP